MVLYWRFVVERKMFELVRVDSLDSCKIILPVGSHVFGRGQLLDIHEKELRISKTHGRIDVSKNSISIFSTHTNPCFIQKEGSDKKIVLSRNNSYTLAQGDKIGLLPDSFWYKVIYMQQEADSSVVNSTIISESDRQVSHSNDLENECHTNEVECRNNKCEGGKVEDNEVTLDIVIENEDNTQAGDSPSILETNVEVQTIGIIDNYITSHTLKRCHSTSETGSAETCTKLFKSEQEPSTSKCGQSELIKQKNISDVVVKTESDKIEHNSDENESSNNELTSKDTNSVPPIPPFPGNSVKERCMYGANCYRRNPQHKAQYSHPSEAEWGAGDRGVCPWGARCRRRDLRHWRDHDHPPGTHPPAPRANSPQPAQKKAKKRNKTIEVSPVSFDNLPAKRTRKITKRPSWSGSESENEYDIEDPFLTDGSDEWLPSGSEGYTESQEYSQCD